MLLGRIRTPKAPSPGRVAGSIGISAVLHAIIALVLALVMIRQQVPDVWNATQELAVSLIEWTAPPVLPRERPQVVRPPEDLPPDEPEPAETRPTPSKPTVRTGIGVSVARGPVDERVGLAPNIVRRMPLESDRDPDAVRPEARLGISRLGSREIDRIRMPAVEPVAYVGSDDVIPVELPEGRLDGDSPDVARGNGFFEARRGLGAGNAPDGGGYGGGNTSLIGTSNGVYRSLMTRLAKGIVAASSKDDVDIVFIVDTTQSMEDNIRGVRAYVDEFVDVLTWERRRPQFGLVTFRDVVRERPKVRGMTEKSGDLRNWMHRAEFAGGGDIAESGLDAVMAAVEQLRFRKNAHKRFILMSDGPFHDRDYDGQSKYTLDEVIHTLQAQGVTVDSVALDHLPMQQLAWGTGGRWIPIPGKGYLEQIALPLPVRSNAALGVLSTSEQHAQDELYVFADPNQDCEWAELRWRVLNPRGEKVRGEFVERAEYRDFRITFQPVFDPLWFQAQPGYYTLIYRVTDNVGRSSVLRRVIEYR